MFLALEANKGNVCDCFSLRPIRVTVVLTVIDIRGAADVPLGET